MAARCVFNGNNFAHLQQRIGSNGWRPSEALPPSPSHTLFVQCYYSLSQWQRGRKTTRTTAAASPRLGRESQSRSAGRPPSLPPSFWTRALGLFILACSRAPSERCQSVRGPSVRPSVRVRPFHWAFFPLLPSIPFYLRLGGVRERGRLALVRRREGGRHGLDGGTSRPDRRPTDPRMEG